MPEKVVVLASSDRADIFGRAKILNSAVAELAPTELIDLFDDVSLSDHDFSLAIVVGGDGSILRAARLMGANQRPTLGVNMGRLGFLADLSVDELRASLLPLLSGEFPVVEHLMFDCELRRGGQTILHQLGLNETAIFAGPPFSIIEIDLYVDAILATTYSCDGLIVSTPVGSTAHNVSAGGPILRQDLQAFVISPISPHTLTNRPVVDSASRCYELTVAEPHEGTTLVVDGRVQAKLEPGDRVRICRASACFRLVKLPGHNYYRTLREKLGWGGRLTLKGQLEP